MPKPPNKFTVVEAIAGGCLLGSLIAGTAFMVSLAIYAQERKEMLQTEWKLKYDESGNPRPEYWQHLVSQKSDHQKVIS